MKTLPQFPLLGLTLALCHGAFGQVLQTQPDWLIDPTPFKASVGQDQARQELVLENGLVRRALRLAPNAATVDYRSLVTGEQLLRATGPEAVVTLNGQEYAVGGLTGQPVQNYLKAQWLADLRALPNSYQFAGWREEPVTARFPWKKRTEWLARDLPWPAPGRQVVLRFTPPATVPRDLTGPVLFQERFGARLDPAWKVRVSPAHSRSSFSNEGKPGEIFTPPDSAVYADRPWPDGGRSVEVALDTGDDTLANAWGPGLALLGGQAPVHFIIRPNQQVFEINGQLLGSFDRAKPVHLRVRLDKGQAVCEASQDGGRTYGLVATVACPTPPSLLRVGKTGRGGQGKDFSPIPPDSAPVRCHLRQVTVRGAEASPTNTPRADLPEIDVHYTIYDGLPLLEKWLTFRNTSGRPVRIHRTVVETLRVQENESATEPNINWELSSLYVETDYAYLSMNAKSANMRSVRWLPDPSYSTQVSYPMETPCLLECAPEFGPEVDLAPGATFTSMRCFELLRDGSDRERRGLAQRRLYRTVAPWTQENPVMVHLISNNPQAIRQIVDQGAEVGVEMIILSFGSGLNMENPDSNYHARYKEVADYAKSKGIVLGSYSLLASRGAGTAADNCGGPGSRIRYGVMPCLGSKWGQEYLAQLQSFLTRTGFGILEHDGSYPGDTCAHTNHPGHRGLGDSQSAQFTAIARFYQWCRANGIYLNVPDWYYLNGSTKCAMNYKETNWSLPRDEQEIIERQNVYDGTWEKTASMGWMFVPLTQYHGGGAAATIEPLSEHLDHYEARLADLFGAGVQACYRGPRIYDTDATKAVVKRWISFYKQHRQVLDSDLVHLRRPDGRDWDGFLHVNPRGPEKGLAFFYNPLPQAITRPIRVPLYYTGLSATAQVSVEGAPPTTVQLDRSETATLQVTIPGRKRTWLLFTTARP